MLWHSQRIFEWTAKVAIWVRHYYALPQISCDHRSMMRPRSTHCSLCSLPNNDLLWPQVGYFQGLGFCCCCMPLGPLPSLMSLLVGPNVPLWTPGAMVELVFVIIVVGSSSIIICYKRDRIHHKGLGKLQWACNKDFCSWWKVLAFNILYEFIFTLWIHFIATFFFQNKKSLML